MSSTSTRAQGPLPLVIGVTGHRDLRPEDLDTLRARVDEIFAQLEETCPHTPLILLSSLAEGADRLVARVALEHGARLIAPLPLRRELYEADFPETVGEFRTLYERADPGFELAPT